MLWLGLFILGIVLLTATAYGIGRRQRVKDRDTSWHAAFWRVMQGFGSTLLILEIYSFGIWFHSYAGSGFTQLTLTRTEEIIARELQVKPIIWPANVEAGERK